MVGKMNQGRVDRENHERGTHVGVISNGSDLTSARQGALSRTLTQIALYNPGLLLLHHGCGRGADEFAHSFARRLGGWRIHGHPVRDAPGSPPRHITQLTRELGYLAASKPRYERDADIVSASRIVVVVLPHPHREIWKLLHQAALAGRVVIYVDYSSLETKPTGPKVAAGPHATLTALPGSRAALAGLSTAADTIAWAKLQGKQDRRAGATCPDYRAFCARHGLPGSSLAQRMWSAYMRPLPGQQPRAQSHLAVREPVPPRRIQGAALAPPLAVGRKETTRSAASRLRSAVPAQSGIPREWRDTALRTLGAMAEVHETGGTVLLTLSSGGKVLAKSLEPRGRKVAVPEAAAFNKEVARAKLNPPEAQVDNWRLRTQHRRVFSQAVHVARF